jgi:hypothetical protein
LLVLTANPMGNFIGPICSESAAGDQHLNSPNDEISETIAVDIARTGDAEAAVVVGALTIDHEAAAALFFCLALLP